MSDKIIYSELGQVLYSEAPDISDEVHALIRVWNNSIAISVWTGKLRSAGSGFELSQQGNSKLTELIFALKQFYLRNGMGDWNIVHYILLPIEGKFDIEFDSSKELETGDLTFRKYAKNFDSNSRLHH